MAVSGNSISGKGYQSFVVNEGLLQKIVEAVRKGEKDARSSGDVKSFEAFYHGFRQNVCIGRIFVVPASVCDKPDDFPVALLYGTVLRELGLGEETADLVSLKSGSEFDEPEDAKAHLKALKERCFTVDGKNVSLVLFAPSWSGIREYVCFKFTDDEAKLADLLRHLVFGCYFNPAVSGGFDALMTNVDTTKLDVTDVTPKLTYPALTENPLRAYPELSKVGLAKKKVFLDARTADAITKEVLEPAEMDVFDALGDALKGTLRPETKSPEEAADSKYKKPDANAEVPRADDGTGPKEASASPVAKAADYEEDPNVPHCNQCEMMNINGVNCHETGCPNEGSSWDPDSQGWVRSTDDIEEPLEDQYPDETAPHGSCPACGGEGGYMGALGNREHFRCRNCGMDFSHQRTAGYVVRQDGRIAAGPASMEDCIGWILDKQASGIGLSRGGFDIEKFGGRLPEKGSPEWHRLRVAIKTLRMPDAIAGVMGPPTKEEARETLRRYGIDPRKYEAVGKVAHVPVCPTCKVEDPNSGFGRKPVCPKCHKPIPVPDFRKKEKTADTADNPANEAGGEANVIHPKTDAEKANTRGTEPEKAPDPNPKTGAAKCQNPNGSRPCPNDATEQYTDSRGRTWSLCRACYTNSLAARDAKKASDAKTAAPWANDGTPGRTSLSYDEFYAPTWRELAGRAIGLPPRKRAAFAKVSYVEHCKGHKNSKGELAEWCVKSHETGKILSSHTSEEAAKKHLQDMHAHSGSLKRAGNVRCWNCGSWNVHPREDVIKTHPKAGRGALVCDECGAAGDVEDFTKSASGHPPGCECGFCKNKGKLPGTKDDEGKDGKKEAGSHRATWEDRLQNVYDGGFEEFKAYSDMWGLARRLGYESAEAAWQDNPLVTGSVDPKDYGVVREGRKTADTVDNIANEKGGEGAMDPKTDKEKPKTAKAASHAEVRRAETGHSKLVQQRAEARKGEEGTADAVAEEIARPLDGDEAAVSERSRAASARREKALNKKRSIQVQSFGSIWDDALEHAGIRASEKAKDDPEVAIAISVGDGKAKVKKADQDVAPDVAKAKSGLEGKTKAELANTPVSTQTVDAEKLAAKKADQSVSPDIAEAKSRLDHGAKDSIADNPDATRTEDPGKFAKAADGVAPDVAKARSETDKGAKSSLADNPAATQTVDPAKLAATDEDGFPAGSDVPGELRQSVRESDQEPPEREGTVEKIEAGRSEDGSEYSWVTIDGTRYFTLWDAADFPLKEGDRVQFWSGRARIPELHSDAPDGKFDYANILGPAAGPGGPARLAAKQADLGTSSDVGHAGPEAGPVDNPNASGTVDPIDAAKVGCAATGDDLDEEMGMGAMLGDLADLAANLPEVTGEEPAKAPQAGEGGLNNEPPAKKKAGQGAPAPEGEADVEVEDLGSIVLLRPKSDAAREWIDENLQLEDWQWYEGGAAIEHGYADAIIEGMKDDGLNVVGGPGLESEARNVIPEESNMSMEDEQKLIEKGIVAPPGKRASEGGLTPEGEMRLRLAQELIDNDDERIYDVAANVGQIVGNVKHMKWFLEAVAADLDDDEVLEYYAMRPEGEGGALDDIQEHLPTQAGWR